MTGEIVPFVRGNSPGKVTWPVPEGQEPPLNYYHYQPNPPRWRMRDEQGRVLFWIYRVYGKTKKRKPSHPHLHFTWCEFDNGRFAWTQKTFPRPPLGYPLFNVELIIKRSDRVIHIAEGEPKVDTLALLFPDDVWTTTIGGAGRWSETNWSHIAGRTIVLYRDLDSEGLSYVTSIANKALSLGCTVYLVDMEALAAETPRSEARPGRIMPGAENWDIADAIRDWKVVTESEPLPDATSRGVTGDPEQEPGCCDEDACTALVAALKRHMVLFERQSRSEDETPRRAHAHLEGITNNEWHHARIDGALAYLSPESRKVRVIVMRALFSLGPTWFDDMRDTRMGLFVRWARDFENFNEEKAESRWQQLDKQYAEDIRSLQNDPTENVPSRIGIGSLFYHARQQGWRDDGKEILDLMNKQFAFVHSRPKGILDRRGSKTNSVRMLDKTSFANMFAAIKITGDLPAEGGKLNNANKLWVEWRNRTEFMDIGLWPIGKTPPLCLNLFNGLNVKGTYDGDVALGYPTLKEFLLGTICGGNQKDFVYLWRLICWKIQNPTIIVKVALVLRGKKGVGKNTFTNLLLRIFGYKHFVMIDNPEQAKNKFNTWMEDKLIVVFNESIFGHEKSVTSRLNGLITEETLWIEPKGIDMYQVDNRGWYIFLSNMDVAVPVTMRDRRYFILEVPDVHIQDHAYFANVCRAAGIDSETKEFFASDEIEALVADALATDLSQFNRFAVPDTVARQLMAEQTEDVVERYWRMVLQKGDLLRSSLVGSDCVQARRDEDAREDRATVNPWDSPGGMSLLHNAREWFYDDFVKYAEKLSHRPFVPTRDGFNKKVQELMNDTEKKKRFFGFEQRTIRRLDTPSWYVANLDVCRTAYDNARGRAGYDWDSGTYKEEE